MSALARPTRLAPVALGALAALLGACAPQARAPEAAPPEEPARAASPARPSPAQTAAAPRLTRPMVEEALAHGPGRVLEALEFADRPVFRDGRFVGMRLLARHDLGASRALFDLRPGDVVTHVNGVAPRTPDDLVAIAKAARRAPAIVVDLLREGRNVSLAVPIEAP